LQVSFAKGNTLIFLGGRLRIAWNYFGSNPIELASLDGRAATMRLQTYRDENRSRHFDLIGHHWSVDLVAVTAATILVVGFACAVTALLIH
jgi:hypothetical protein